MQSGAERPNLVDFDMSDLCFEVAGRYDALCDKNHWQLDLQANEPCPVSADPAMMERVMHNLLGNAFHHIGADGIVVLRAIPQEKGCRIEIEDHGPGIPPEDLPYIFDRYYRARQDSGRTGTAWACPSRRQFYSSTASPSALTAPLAAARPSGSR